MMIDRNKLEADVETNKKVTALQEERNRWRSKEKKISMSSTQGAYTSEYRLHILKKIEELDEKLYRLLKDFQISDNK